MIGMGCARGSSSRGAATPASAACTASATRSRTAGRSPLELEEHSHAGMANRYAAGASGLPFAVLRGYVGSDLVAHTASIKEVTCPFTGEVLSAVSALELDVAVIHAQQADTSRQRAAVGHRRRAEGGGPLRAARARHGRGDRRGARAAAGRDRAAALDDRLRLGGAERRASVLRARLHASGTTTSTSPGTRSAATATPSGAGWRTMSSRAEPAARAAATVDARPR